MSRIGNESYSRWLKASPCLSLGAKDFLAKRREIRRTPFIPITLFGFAIDDDAKNEWPPARVEPGADLRGQE